MPNIQLSQFSGVLFEMGLSMKSAGSPLFVAMLVAVIGAANSLDTVQADEPQAKKYQVVVVTSDGESDENVPPRKIQVQVSEAKDGAEEESHAKLWVGIMLKDVEGDLAKYLGSEKGILIDDVFEGSPAAKAGIQPGDLLLRANGQELNEPLSLLTTMKKVKDGEAITLTLSRKGEEVEVKVTPTTRPEREELEADKEREKVQALLELSELGEGDREKMKDVLRGLRLKDGTQDVNVLRFGGPAFTWRGTEDKENVDITVVKEIAGDKVEIKITRKDDQPAKITVTKGDKVNEYGQSELDKMPEDIAAIVKGALNSNRRLELRMIPGLADVEIDIDQEEIAQKTREMAEKYRDLALKKQTDQAQASAQRLRAQIEQKIGANASTEVKELRTLVEELREEVKELRKKLNEKDN